MAKLTVIISTFFKKSTANSTTLSDDEKLIVNVGDTFNYDPKSVRFDGSHYRVELEDSIAPWGKIGYFYKPTVQLEVGNDNRVVEIAEEHIGEKYVFGARAQFTNSNYKGPWDCAEFVSWCIYQVTGILYGTNNNNNPRRADAYTGFWLDQARRDNVTVTVEDAARIPGAVVVRHRNGQGHIVISDGKGGTIEARGRRYGVVRYILSGRRWDAGILVPGVEYEYSFYKQLTSLEAPSNVINFSSTLMCGSSVARIQEALKDYGTYHGFINGIFDYQTFIAVEAFQLDNGLIPDGEIGVETLEALKIELE